MTLKLLQRLKQVPDLGSHQPLDYVTLSLLFSLLSCLVVGAGGGGEEHDMSFADDHYPLVSDSTFLPSFHEEILKSDWLNSALHAAVKFVWGVTLRQCSMIEAFKGECTVSVGQLGISSVLIPDQAEFEFDEDMVDEAISNDGLQYLRLAVVASKHFHEEVVVFMERTHWFTLVCLPLGILSPSLTLHCHQLHCADVR